MTKHSAISAGFKGAMIIAVTVLLATLGGCETGRSLVAVPFDVAKFVAVKMAEVPYDAAKMTAQGTYDALAQMGR